MRTDHTIDISNVPDAFVVDSNIFHIPAFSYSKLTAHSQTRFH